MIHKVQLVCLNLNTRDPSVSGMLEKIRADDSYHLVMTATSQEAISAIAEAPLSILIFYFDDRNSLTHVIDTLRATAILSKKQRLKSASYNRQTPYGMNQRRIDSSFRLFHCNDFLAGSIPSRAFKFKIDQWKDFLIKANPDMIYQVVSNPVVEKDQKRSIEFTDELAQFQSDVWLIKPENIRYTNNQYHIQLKGPGPSVAAWVPHEQNIKFLLSKNFASKLVPDGGSWFINGNPPVFDKEKNLWNWVSSNPNLFFIKPDGERLFKIKSTPWILYVNNTTAYTFNKELVIESTFGDESKSTLAPQTPSPNENDLLSQEGLLNVSNGNLDCWLALPGQKTQSFSVQILDFDNEHICFETSLQSIPKSGTLSLEIHFSLIGEVSVYTIGGDIEDIEQNGIYSNVVLKIQDQLQMKNLMKLIKLRQMQIRHYLELTSELLAG